MAMLSKLWYFRLLDDGGRRHALADIAVALLRSDYPSRTFSIGIVPSARGSCRGKIGRYSRVYCRGCPAALESVRKGVELFDSILKKLVK